MSRSYLIHLGIALAVLAAALVVYGFWYAALGTLSSEVAGLTAEVAAKNQNVTQAVIAEDELSKLSDEEGAIRGYFVAPADIVPFLESLQTVGAAAGAKVSVVSVSASPTPRPHLSLALKITGPFDAVLRTVGAIEYGPHDITTTTLSLDQGQGDVIGWSASLAVDVGAASASPAPAASVTTTP